MRIFDDKRWFFSQALRINRMIDRDGSHSSVGSSFSSSSVFFGFVGSSYSSGTRSLHPLPETFKKAELVLLRFLSARSCPSHLVLPDTEVCLRVKSSSFPLFFCFSRCIVRSLLSWFARVNRGNASA